MKRPLPILIKFWLVLSVIISAGYSDEDVRLKRIRDALNKFTYQYYQQKVYLHTDRNEYRSGETIWCKAYLVDGINHLPDTISTNLYVEIISPFKSRVQIKRFQLFKGFGIGDFNLSDTLPEGLYQIRAYTAWMQNFDTEFYFEKNFQLVNPTYKKMISPRQAKINEKELTGREKLTDDIDLQFMPEGGYLVTGLKSTVGFKALNRVGKGVDIKGAIYDDKGNKAADFESFYKGMGRFELTPQKDRKYFAVTNINNKENRIALPEPVETGVVMHVENRDGKIRVEFTTNRQSNDPVVNELILVAQMGGRIYVTQTLKMENGKSSLEIPKTAFPGGVLQITAFSGRGVPLAERLVFIDYRGVMNIKFSASDSLTDHGKKVVVDIEVYDEKKIPVTANLSLAITRQVEEEIPSNHDNIVSNFLVSSDLKGYIEDPLEYFKPNFQSRAMALDNLMLTQGWRRFSWDRILAGEYPEIRFLEEKGITINGKITRDFFGIPLNRCRVQLSIMDEFNDVFTQQSANKGTFSFENMVYYDTVSVKIEAWRPSGRRNLLILLPEGKELDVKDHQGDYFLTTESERDKKLHRQEVYEENRKAYIEEQKQLAEKRKNSMVGLYGEPDFVMYSEDFHQVNGNILDVMKGRVPGVQITGNDVNIRGIHTFYGSTQPLYLVDGTPVRDVSAVTSIPIEDIERVEVLKGPSTAFYGSQGANGVIAIYTKRGQFMIRGKIEFDMLGYSTPRVFYQPSVEFEKEAFNNYTLIWNPVIITDKNGKARFVFDKPAIQGDYYFDIQGVSYYGHVGYTAATVYNQ